MKSNRDVFIPEFERPIRIPARIRIEIAQPNTATAGKKITLRMKFPIPKNIEPGETLKLQIFGGRNNKGYFKNLQSTRIIVQTANGVPLNIKYPDETGGTIVIAVPERGLKAGDHLRVILKNIRCQEQRLLNKFFVLYKDDLKTPEKPHKAEGIVWNRENQKRIMGAWLMHILGGKIHHIKVFAPSNTIPGKQFTLLVRPEDRFHNLSSEYPKNIRIFCGKTRVYGKIEKVDNSTCIRVCVKLKNQGVFRIRVKHGQSVAVSNPVICEKNEGRYNLYWGMIHAHTEMSDGAGTIDYYFHQLKNESGLDFGASGDHDHTWETTEKMWKKTCKTVKKWNQEGRFITFPGYEWAKWRRNGDGDRNVYYYLDDRPMYRSDEGHYPNPPALFQALKKEKAIVIPHHTAHGGNFCDWKDHDEEKERLIEIYQQRGSYECSEKQGSRLGEFCLDYWQ